jgi:hypothetical protein
MIIFQDFWHNLYTLKKFIFLQKELRKKINLLVDLSIFLKTCCQKNLSKFSFYEKIKMFKKDPFVVESFVIVGSFDYDCTHMQCDTFNSKKVFHNVQVGSIFSTN